MEILICGSAAAEGIPAVFCNCRVCENARRKGGREIRSRSCYRIDRTFGIDANMDFHWQENRYCLRSDRLRHLFFTHSHEDHLDPYLFSYRRPGMSVVPPENILTVYGNPTVLEYIRDCRFSRGNLDKLRLKPVELEFFRPIAIPEEETEVLPLPANHDPAEKAMIFAIRRQGRQLLVANDPGWPADEVFDALRDWRFDAVIADCTGGTFTNGVNHMGGMVTVELRDRLKEQGSLAPECRFIANHFSHNGNCTYEEIVNFFTPHGIETAYDGFRFTL